MDSACSMDPACSSATHYKSFFRARAALLCPRSPPNNYLKHWPHLIFCRRACMLPRVGACTHS